MQIASDSRCGAQLGEFLAASPLGNLLFDASWYLDRYPFAASALDECESLTAFEHLLKFGIPRGYVGTPYFDAEWYLNTYPDVETTLFHGASRHQQALAHYLQSGCAESRNPAAIFDEKWYGTRYNDPGPCGGYVNNYHHFLAEGAAAGLSPSPLFDELWYRRQYSDVAEAIASGLVPSGYHDYARSSVETERNPCPYFDVRWYRRTYLEKQPLKRLSYFDFLTSGAAGGYNPSLHFDESWYRTAYSDVRTAIERGKFRSGYHHYLYDGAQRGYNPNPYFQSKWYAGWYPEVREKLAGGIYSNPFEHYLSEGAAGGLSPNLYFDETWYLHNNRDLQEARAQGQVASGHLHYLHNGVHERRSASTLFDSEWYRKTYPEVEEYIQNGLATSSYDHFCRFGWKAGLSTCPDFDETWYREQNPEVEAQIRQGLWESGLHHFVVDGLIEGRQPKADLKPDREDRNLATTTLARMELRQFLHGPEELVCETSSKPVVSILLVLYNRAELTLRCLKSIACWAGLPYEIVIVDNASTDETAAMLERVRGVRVFFNPRNLHFLLGANQAAKQARGEYLLFLNNDSELQVGALGSAAGLLRQDAGVGAVGAKIILNSGVLQEAGSYLETSGFSAQFGRGRRPFDSEYMHRRDVPYCSGAFLMTPRRLFRELGGFDPAFLPAYCEDVDYCLRLWEKGLRVVYNPASIILHHETGSSRYRRFLYPLVLRNIAVLRARYREYLATMHDFGAAPVSTIDGRRLRSGCLVIVPDIEAVQEKRFRETLLAPMLEDGLFVTVYPLEPWFGERAGLTIPDEVEIVAESGRNHLQVFCKKRARTFQRAILFLGSKGQPPAGLENLRHWLDGVDLYSE